MEGTLTSLRERSSIEPTEYRGLKSEDSAAEVQIDPLLAEELRKFKPAGEPLFVIESPLRPRPGIDRQYYRAEPVFRLLYVWLRRKGIKKPLSPAYVTEGVWLRDQRAFRALRGHDGAAALQYCDHRRSLHRQQTPHRTADG